MWRNAQAAGEENGQRERAGTIARVYCNRRHGNQTEHMGQNAHQRGSDTRGDRRRSPSYFFSLASLSSFSFFWISAKASGLSTLELTYLSPEPFT